jgi:hypothetical protein
MPWRFSSRITRASVDSRRRFGFSALLVRAAFSATGFVVSAFAASVAVPTARRPRARKNNA